LRKDGSPLFVEVATAPFLDATGNYDGAVAGLIDITERRQAEKRLARLNECFLSFGPDPMANINMLTALCGELLGADCALYNRLHEEMLCSWGQWQTPAGYNPVDNPEGHICYDVIRQAQEDVVIIRNLPETDYAETDPTVIPFKLQTYVGKAIQFEGNAVGSLCVVFMQDFDPAAEDLQIMTLIGSAIATVEKRLQAEMSLKEAHEQLQATFNALPDLLFELDRDGRFHDFRVPDFKMLYVPPEEFLGKTISEVMSPKTAGIIMEAIERAATVGRYTSAVYALELPNGRRWFEATIAAKETQASEKGRFIALARDVTEQVRAEAALRESNENLETTLAELKETQAQMVQQERQAAVGQLAAGIAHDFNNLMAAILLHAELMLKTSALSPKDRQKIELIHEQGQRAADLTQQILDFSRKSIMHRETLDLCPFLQDLYRLFIRTLPENIQLFLNCQMNTCLVDSDPTRLQQAILNLVINARDAMPDGGTLKIELRQVVVEEGEERPFPQLTPGIWACISVTDSGSGISASDMDHVFEPFFTTKAPLGSGLGLSQVYGIIKQHEGYIDVTTKVDEGSTFFLYLPMLISTQPAALPAQIEELSLGHDEPILIVEDNDLVRESLVEAIAMLNYRPFSVTNGREALDFCQSPENKIALIITDLIMPEMGGEQLIKQLHKLLPDMKVIIITGFPDDPKLKQVAEMGFRNIFTKPLNLKDFMEEVDNNLRK